MVFANETESSKWKCKRRDEDMKKKVLYGGLGEWESEGEREREREREGGQR